MTAEQLALVHDGVDAHQAIRGELARAVPFWPLGLPDWVDSWVALGVRTGVKSVLAVWRRPGVDAVVDLPLPHLRDTDPEIDVLYPRRLITWPHDWDADEGMLHVEGGPALSARVFRLRDPGVP